MRKGHLSLSFVLEAASSTWKELNVAGSEKLCEVSLSAGDIVDWARPGHRRRLSVQTVADLSKRLLRSYCF